MEIQWGDNLIIIDTTVAMILSLIPLVLVLEIPKFRGAIRNFLGRAEKRMAQKFPGHYGKHKGA